MNAKRVNHVINLLINEIKLNEQSGNARESANAKELSREKGINVAKSFLNINHSAISFPFGTKVSRLYRKLIFTCENPIYVYLFCASSHTDEEKDRETTKGGKKSDDRNDENVNTQKNEKELSDDNIDDDFIRDNEKAALEFYDDKIDNYDEEYVNKKYSKTNNTQCSRMQRFKFITPTVAHFCKRVRYNVKPFVGFGTDSCDSSLCCCGCFIPVCYQSQRHECYINQYRSLYAVNVRINDKTEFDEKEINPKKGDEENGSNEMKENVDEIGENASNSVITTEGTKNGQSGKSLKYYAVFCVNCNNHIAYFEIEKKIFHFFDVLPD
ncbi:E2F-associated phosphoprotein, putative [Plasmodium ovale wallikeri]|uniref:E2F-associated phosphoprotein, putative n=1 Tax=Plasmodium ovale wallikeri TaxID=864142 RepID=A0A1A8YJ01_PLAOA|nr:E2F-associated phosphoprotein, putative [Plasmodium ovale wallikeri]SBT32068.1 E2F-associated phosphoprotein, putative [Plasmodium ovale wallikeri]